MLRLYRSGLISSPYGILRIICASNPHPSYPILPLLLGSNHQPRENSNLEAKMLSVPNES